MFMYYYFKKFNGEEIYLLDDFSPDFSGDHAYEIALEKGLKEGVDGMIYAATDFF